MFGGAQRQDEGQRAQIGAQGVLCEREEELCAVRVAEPWHRMPRQVVEPPLVIFKTLWVPALQGSWTGGAAEGSPNSYGSGSMH